MTDIKYISENAFNNLINIGVPRVSLSSYTDATIAGKFASAQADLLTRHGGGEIYVDIVGTLTLQIILEARITLRIIDCLLTCHVNDIAILMKSDSSIIGRNQFSSVIKENHFGNNIKSTIRSYGNRAYPYEDTDRNLVLKTFGVDGEGLDVGYDAAIGTIALGNVKDTEVDKISLYKTKSLGLNIGGFNNNDKPYAFADRYSVTDCSFNQVASNALNPVNSRSGRIVGNKFRDLGFVFPNGFVTNAHAIDCETNQQYDRIESLIIAENDIDNENSAGIPSGSLGNGIVMANENGSRYVGENQIIDNLIRGGNVRAFTDNGAGGGTANDGIKNGSEVWNPTNGLASGIRLIGIADTIVAKNRTLRLSQYGIGAYDCLRLDIFDNRPMLNSLGGIEIHNTFDSHIHDNKSYSTDQNIGNDYGIKQDGENWGGTANTAFESGTSDRNRFSNNTGFTTILTGANSTNGPVHVVTNPATGTNIVLPIGVIKRVYSHLGTGSNVVLNLIPESFIVGAEYEFIKHDAAGGMLRINIPSGKTVAMPVAGGGTYYCSNGYIYSTMQGAGLTLEVLASNLMRGKPENFSWTFVSN